MCWTWWLCTAWPWFFSWLSFLFIAVYYTQFFQHIFVGKILKLMINLKRVVKNRVEEFIILFFCGSVFRPKVSSTKFNAFRLRKTLLWNSRTLNDLIKYFRILLAFRSLVLCNIRSQKAKVRCLGIMLI